MTSCNFCKLNKVKLINLKYKYVTSDINKTNLKPQSFICLNCNLIQKKVSKRYLNGIGKIYKNYVGFEKYNQLDQTKFVGNQMNSRCNIIYKALFPKKNYNFKKKILDFGCSNGAMIKPLLENKNKFDIYGTDIKNHLNTEFVKNKNFKQFIPLKKIYDSRIKFDYIFLIHVFEHLIDLNEFLTKIAKILAKNGKIIIQIPNYFRNPYDLLIYDHAYHFDKFSLQNIYNFHSYKFKINENLIPGEFFITLSKSSKKINKTFKNNYNSSLKKIDWLYNTFKSLKKVNSFSVIGSSVTSLIIVSNFYNKIFRVYDEDIQRQGKLFNGLKIRPLSDYKKEKLFFPFFGLKLLILKSKFLNKYKNLKIIV